ncbi:N-terminal phage integrase SAM-like domain-containing protein, partial [Streptococcus anginosus]
IDKNLTVNQLYQEWLEQYRLDVEESTLRNTETYFKLHILPAFGDIKINQLKTSTIQKEVNVWYRKFQKHRKIFNYLKR